MEPRPRQLSQNAHEARFQQCLMQLDRRLNSGVDLIDATREILRA